MHLCIVGWIALVLAIVGGVNWGLVGFLEYDLVANLLGEMTTASRVVYGAVGVSAVYLLLLVLGTAFGLRKKSE